MKKIISITLGLVMMFSLVACGNTSKTNKQIETQTETQTESQAEIQTEESTSEQQAPSTVTITTLNGEKEKVEIEVPYNPERLAVLDMASLDILDNWDLGDRVVGMPKSSEIDYLSHYNANEDIANLGTVKEVDMEALMASEPDLIFIGGRLASQYDALSQIAPVVYFGTDYEIGLIESVKTNVANVATIFGMEEMAAQQTADFESRAAALATANEGKSVIIGMVTSAEFKSLGDGSRCSLIGNEAGFMNLANDVDSTHGNETSFEFLVDKNPDYIFVLDRDSAINAEGAQLAKDIMDNELVHKTSAFQNSKIFYLTPTVWYLAEGGITATDVMLSDLESALQ